MRPSEEKMEAAITAIMEVLGWEVESDREAHPEEHAEDRFAIRSIIEGLLNGVA